MPLALHVRDAAVEAALEKIGLVYEKNGTYFMKMKPLLDAINANKRWSDLGAPEIPGLVNVINYDFLAVPGIKTAADLKGKKVAVQLGTTGEEEAKKIDGVTVKPFDTADLAFQELMNGQVEAVVVDAPTTTVYTDRNKDKIKTVGEPFTDEKYGIAVCKKNTDLLNKINAGLAAVEKDGTIRQLQEKWLAARLDGTRAIKTALVALAATFSDDQKKADDDLLAPHMGMMSGMRGGMMGMGRPQSGR